jgi:hypothetical protein
MRLMRIMMCSLLGSAGACGSDEDAAGQDGADATGSANPSGGDDGGTTGSAPPPGPSAEGWESDYVDGSSILGCEQSPDEMRDSGAARLSFGDSTIYVGYEQIGDNQNPVVVRVDDGEQLWCRKHETEPPDGRALGITWDGGDEAYVVYTIVGGGSALDEAASGGFVPSYAPGAISGGGSKVSFVGRVDTRDGALSAGTFIIAVKSDNKVNTHNPAGAVIVREDGTIEFRGGSAHKPIDVDLKAMDCTDYPFDSRYVLSPDLSEAVCADCTNCTAQRPCPDAE